MKSGLLACVISALLAQHAWAVIIASTDTFGPTSTADFSTTGWIATDVSPTTGWNTDAGFDTSSWTNHVVRGAYPVGFSNNSSVQSIWRSNVSNDVNNGWFRNEFTINGTLVNPELDVFFDDNGEFYLNGHLLLNDHDNVAQGVPGGWLNGLDISQYLVSGTNLIAFHTNNAGGAVYASVSVQADAVAPAASTPEPGTFAIWSLGSVASIYAAYRRKKKLAE